MPKNTQSDVTPKEIRSDRWLRNGQGTYLITYPKKGEPELKAIANHGVQIKTILFLLHTNICEVQYVLRFFTQDGPVDLRVRHEDLADERTFLNVAPPGFALTYVSHAFSVLRECLMGDLVHATREAILTVLGWYIWQNNPVFAHAGGVICSDVDSSGIKLETVFGTAKTGSLVDIDQLCSDVPILAGQRRPIEKVHVQVPEQFRKYRLQTPASKAEAREALRAVFDLLAIGDPDVTYICVSAIFMTALRDPRFALFLYGETGSLKTAFALLLLAFFVADPQESDSASFKSTAIALAARFATSGNVPVIVDDYIQLPGARQIGEEAKKADNLIRSIVNGNGRERAFGNGSLRPTDRPRGIAVITGEELPSGLDSLKRRTINIPVDKYSFANSLKGPRPNQFDGLQKLAEEGVLTKAMAGFTAWAAGRFVDLQGYLDNPGHRLTSNDNSHRRLPDAANDILSGAGALLWYAQDLDAITEDEAEKHAGAAISAVESMLQRAYLESLDDCPTEAFAQLLQASMAALRCHIEVKDIVHYAESDNAIPLELLGYTEHEDWVPADSGGNDTPTNKEPESGNKDSGAQVQSDMVPRTVYRPHGVRIGWLENDCIDLIPDAALAEANGMASRSGANRLPSKKSFGKMLASSHWIASQTKDRNTYKVRRDTVVHDVWRIHAFRLFELPLAWGDFDVESYKEKTEAERLRDCLQRREEATRQFRERLTRFQVDSLLNPHLNESDRQKLLTPDPILSDAGATVQNGKSRIIPYPPKVASYPGNGLPEGDGLLA